MSDSDQPERGHGWKGLHIMRGRKGYADTPMGQLHYRVLGEGIPLLLLHQTAWFAVQYAGVQPLLAEAGIQSIAVDTPGFGFSDGPTEQPTIEQYSDNLPYVLDALGLEKASVAGMHTGAAIGSAFALRHPERLDCLVLDGPTLYTDEERARRLAIPHWDQTPKPDGSHFSDRFMFLRDRVSRHGASVDAMNWSALSFFMAGETEDFGHVAAYRYDMTPAIPAITAPTLVMSHTGDAIHQAAARILKMRPDFEYHESEDGHSMMIFDDPASWAKPVIEFITAHAGA